MNQQELIDRVTDYANKHFERSLSKADVKAVLDSQASVAIGVLSDLTDEVTLPNLGKLKAARRAGRTGRNPKTGETLEIPPKNFVKFVPAKALKEALA